VENTVIIQEHQAKPKPSKFAPLQTLLVMCQTC
jgi:hypothetical protein